VSLSVAEAIRLAKEWVDRYAAQNPDFRGAHLMGGITSMPKGAGFPRTSDLDLAILVATPPISGRELIEEFYRGVPIEAGLRSIELYSSPATVLANPDLACHLAVDSILSDPCGLLAAVQPVVAAEYARPRWVTMRCEWEKKQVLTSLARAARATTPAEFLPEMVFEVLVYLSGLIAVASVRPPTHLKCLVLLRELLTAQGRGDLYEDMLAIGGSSGLGPTQVSAYAEQTSSAFDRAVEVRRTPVWGDFKLRPHLRPYLVDGTDLMIEQGNHREVMPWICMGLAICTSVIRNDAPPEESAHYDRILGECFELLGIDTPESRSEKLQRAVAVKDSLFALADEMVARLPDDLTTTAATA
jgi:hypothetical protein